MEIPVTIKLIQQGGYTMKLLANLRTKSEEDAESLIHAFLKAFNPANSILIRGEEVTIELELNGLSPEVFEDVSSAIGHCEIVLLRYGTVSETEAASKTEEQVDEEETSREVEEHSPSASTDSNSEDSKASSTSLEKEQLIQKLDELAQTSKSYGTFLKSVMRILELDKRNSLFLVNVLRVTGDVDSINWDSIGAKLSEIGVKTSKYDIQKLKNQINKYTNMRVIDFIKLLETYKSKFSTQPDSNTEGTTNNSQEAEESAKMPEHPPKESDSQEEVVSQDVAELLKDSKLEIRFKHIDRREELSSRIVKILDYMGWSSLNGTDQYVVLSIWQVAVKLKDITFANIFVSPKLTGYTQEKYVAIFSNFINRYMKRIGIKEEIDPIAFLEYSKKYILTERERQTL